MNKLIKGLYKEIYSIQSKINEAYGEKLLIADCIQPFHLVDEMIFSFFHYPCIVFEPNFCVFYP